MTHVPQYFETHDWTLRASSEEYLESTHSALRKMEERFSVRTKGRRRGTITHQERLLRSSYLFNFSCLGFLPHKFEEDEHEDEDVTVPDLPHLADHTYCQKVCVH